MKPGAKIKAHSGKIMIAVIILINLIIYFNGINNGFVWDDKELIRDNHLIRDVGNIRTLLTTEDAVAGFSGTGFFRPLINVTYLIDYQLHKGSAAGYRLTNVAMHIVCALVLFYLTMLLTGNRLMSFAASLIFSVQAVHVEAVTFLSSRNNVLCTLFILLSFYLYIRGNERAKTSYLFYSAFLIFLGAASKEFAFMAPFIFILYDYTFDESFSLKRRIGSYAILFSPILVFIAYKSMFVPIRSSFVLEPSTLLKRIITTLPIMKDYIVSQIFPYKLSAHADYPLSASLDVSVILSFIILAGMTTGAFLMRKKDKVLFFSFFAYFLLLSPVSNIIKMPGTIMADRWLYPASFAFSILLARLIFIGLNKKRELIPFVTALFVMYMSYFAVQRNDVFKSDFLIFSDTIKKYPDDATARTNLANEYDKMGDYNEAGRQYLLAIEYNPKLFLPYNNLGILYGKRKNDWAKALEYLKKAYELNPRFAYTAHSIGYAYTELGNMDEGNKFYNTAISLDPNNYDSYFNLAVNYFNQKKLNEALSLMKKVLSSSYDQGEKEKANNYIKIINQEMKKGK